MSPSEESIGITDAVEAEEPEVTFFHDFIAGGLAGSASVVAGHPFDTIKVRMQTSKTPASLVSMASSFGGVSSLFRGMSAPLSTAAVVNAVVFASYGTSSRIYESYFPTTGSNMVHDPWQKAMVCGSFAGLVQCLIICPMEHIKCRIQVQHGKGSADHVFRGPVHATHQIVKQHGLSALFRGWWITCLRDIPAFGVYFSAYDFIKDSLLQRYQIYASSHTWVVSALAGGISGSLTWLMVYPADVIKSRIQTTPLDTPRSERASLHIARDIIQKQGWRFLFRGLGITVLRGFPVNGIIFPVYEFTLGQIHRLEGYPHPPESVSL